VLPYDCLLALTKMNKTEVEAEDLDSERGCGLLMAFGLLDEKGRRWAGHEDLLNADMDMIWIWKPPTKSAFTGRSQRLMIELVEILFSIS